MLGLPLHRLGSLAARLLVAGSRERLRRIDVEAAGFVEESLQLVVVLLVGLLQHLQFQLDIDTQRPVLVPQRFFSQVDLGEFLERVEGAAKISLRTADQLTGGGEDVDLPAAGGGQHVLGSADHAVEAIGELAR